MAASGSGLTLGTLWLQVEAQFDDATKALQQFGTQVGNQLDEQKKKWDGLSNVGDSFISLGGSLTAALTVPLVGVGAAAVGAADKLQIARSAFTTMLGSAEAADSMLKQLQLFAASTPFEFPELVTAAQKMKALGFQADDIIPTLRTVGDTAAAMGRGAETIDRITLALGQMGAKGKVSAEEMRQLAEAGIPAWQYLADAIGKSIPEAMKLAENGAISSSKAIPAILAGMNKDFAGSMDNLSKTLSGQWSNIRDQLTMALIPIGQILIPSLQSLIPVASSVLSSVGDMARGFQLLPTPIQDGVVGVLALTAALGPMILGLGAGMRIFAEIAPQLTILYNSVSNVAYALSNGLTPALFGWEKALLLVGSAAVVLAGVFLVDKIGQWYKATQDAEREAYLFEVGLNKLGDRVTVLDDLLAKGKITIEQYRAAITGIGKLETQSLGFSKAEQAAKDFHAEVAATTPSIEELEKKLGEYGIGAVQGARTTDQFRDALIDQIAALKKSGQQTIAEQNATRDAADAKKKAADAAAALKKKEEDLADAAANAAAAHKKLEANLKDAKENLAAVEDQAKRNVVGWDATTAAQAKVTTAQKALDKEFQKMHPDLVVLTGSVSDFGKAVQANFKPMTDQIQKADEAEVAWEAGNAAIAGLADEMARAPQPVKALGAALGDTVGPAYTARDAYKELHLTSLAGFDAMAAHAALAYNTIATTAGTSAEMERRAFIVAMQAQAEYEASLGGVSAATQTQLAAARMAEDDYFNNSVKGWENLAYSLKNSMQGVFHEITTAVFSGDWAQAKDKILDDLQNMGEAVLEKFTKPATDAIATFVANTLVSLLSGQGLQGVMNQVTALGTALGGIFKQAGAAGATTPPFAGGSIPGLGGGGGGGSSSGGSAASGLGGAGGVLGMVNAITGVVSAVTGVLQLFGVGQGGQKDRLNMISDNTWSTAWSLEAGGMRVAILDIRNMLYNFTQPTLEHISNSLDHLNDVLAEATDPGRSWNVNLNGTDPSTVASYLATQLRMQGGAA